MLLSYASRSTVGPLCTRTNHRYIIYHQNETMLYTTVKPSEVMKEDEKLLLNILLDLWIGTQI